MENWFSVNMSVILDNGALRAKFMGFLCRIGKQVIASKGYKSHWGFAEKGIAGNGNIVEEIYLALAESHNYDPNDQSYPLNSEPLDVKHSFHKLNFQKRYDVRIPREELKLVLSEDTFLSFFGAVVNRLYDSKEYDLDIVKKYQLAREIVDGTLHPTKIDNADFAAQSATVKATLGKLTYMSKEYNRAGVPNNAPKEKTHLIMTEDFYAQRDNNFLASVFHLEKADFDTRYNLVDSFALTSLERDRIDNLMSGVEGYRPLTDDENSALEQIGCVAMDIDWYQDYETEMSMRVEEATNPKNLNTYVFLHCWYLFGTSPYHQATVFVTTESGLSAITIGSLSYDSTTEAQIFTEADTDIDDQGYAEDQCIPWVFNVAVKSAGQGTYPKVGNVEPEFVNIELSGNTDDVKDAIADGSIKVYPTPGSLGKVTWENDDSEVEDVTNDVKLYTVSIPAKLRQAMELDVDAGGDPIIKPLTYTNELTIKFTFRGKSEECVVNF